MGLPKRVEPTVRATPIAGHVIPPVEHVKPAEPVVTEPARPVAMAHVIANPTQFPICNCVIRAFCKT